MAYAPNHETVLGSFTECNYGNHFQFSENDQLVMASPAHGGPERVFPHRVWVGGAVNDQGWRAALVLKTCVHIITDETDAGWVVERWRIKNLRNRG